MRGVVSTFRLSEVSNLEWRSFSVVFDISIILRMYIRRFTTYIPHMQGAATITIGEVWVAGWSSVLL